METTIIESMSLQEAEICLKEIQAHFESAADLAHEFDRRLGWKALGYVDLRSCLIDRFNRHGYRLFRLFEVRSNIALSPMGQNEPVDQLRERHVRESGISDLEPDQQVEAFQLAKQMAIAENTRIQATHVTKAVAQVMTKATVFQSTYVVVTHMVVSGAITADTGHAFVAALDKQHPKKRGHIVQLMGKFGLTCPALVEPLAGLFDRPPGQESLVLPEVLRGYLGGVALKLATLTDLANANEEARQEHIRLTFERQQEATPSVKAEIVTIYKGDPRKTLAALRSVLGDEVYNLRDLLMED